MDRRIGGSRVSMFLRCAYSVDLGARNINQFSCSTTNTRVAWKRHEKFHHNLQQLFLFSAENTVAKEGADYNYICIHVIHVHAHVAAR